jgi:hypothetical protein
MPKMPLVPKIPKVGKSSDKRQVTSGKRTRNSGEFLGVARDPEPVEGLVTLHS